MSGPMRGRLVDMSIGLNRKYRVTVEVDRDFREDYEKLKGQELDVDIRKHRDKRSKSANAYFHVLVNKIASARGGSDDATKKSLVIEYGALAKDDDGFTVGFKLPASVDVDTVCTNDTYWQIWNRIPPARPKYLGAYSCRIARNICLNRYYSNTAQKRNSYYDVALEELEETIPALSTVESVYDAKELTGYLNLFLKGLSREDRYLFMRRYWYGDGIHEIAVNMGIKDHNASVRLFRLRQKLQNYLQKEGMIE